MLFSDNDTYRREKFLFEIAGKANIKSKHHLNSKLIGIAQYTV